MMKPMSARWVLPQFLTARPAVVLREFASTRRGVYVLSILLHLMFAPFFIHDWDGFVFVQVARDALDGMSPYAVAQSEAPHIFVGDAVPIVNTWYAYPPLALLLMVPPFAMFTFFYAAPWVERLAIKLPFIAGDLLLAALAAALVGAVLRERGHADAQERAFRIERLLLLNPFLIFVSAVWGMFDVWMMAFLVLTLLLILRGSFGWAGVAFAGSVLVKLFPAFLGPALLVFAWSRGGARQASRMVGAGMATGVLVCLPFLLDAPQGFLTQVLTNHAQRPPQGFTLIGLPLAFPWLNELLGTRLPAHVTPEALSRLSFVLMLVVVGVLHLRVGKIRDVPAFVRFSLVLMLGVLLVSKVVNEQYFLMPVVLAALGAALHADAALRRLYLAYSWGGLVSGLILGWHFITFIPNDVARVVFPWPPGETVGRIQQAIGWSGEQSFVLPTLIAAAALLPALVLSVRLVANELHGSVRGLLSAVRPSPGKVSPVTLLLLVVLLVAPVSTAVFSGVQEGEENVREAVELPQGATSVALVYDTRWHNPSHSPLIRAGAWEHSLPLVPEEGYYSVSAGRILHDFRGFEAAGVDVVLVNARGDLFAKAPSLARAAQATGLAVAPLVELEPFHHDPARQPRDRVGSPADVAAGLHLDDITRERVAAALDAALKDTAAARPARVDGGLLVVVPDALVTSFDHEPVQKERTLDVAAAVASSVPAVSGDPSRSERPSRDELEAAYPVGDWRDSRYADIWVETLSRLLTDFWTEVRAEVEAKHGPLFLVAGAPWSGDSGRLMDPRLSPFDATYAGSAWGVSQAPSGSADEPLPAAMRMEMWLTRQAQLLNEAPSLTSVAAVPAWPAGAAAREQRDVFLDVALEQVVEADSRLIVLDAWNRFDRGMAFEPTREDGARAWWHVQQVLSATAVSSE